MFRKMICLVYFILVLALVGDVQAAEVTWTDAGPDQLWSTPTNWNTGTLPTLADEVYINVLPGPTIANEGAVAFKPHVGFDQTGALTLDGGTLTISDWLIIATKGLSEGTVNMISGTITISGSMKVGQKGLGTLNMTGGTIVLGNEILIGNNTISTGHVNLNGGVIAADNLVMRVQDGAIGTMNVTAGTLITNGNDRSTIQGYIDNGWITAYYGQGTLQLDYDVTNELRTTLTAIPNLRPNPADGSIISPPGAVELSWTLPDPCEPGQPVLVDVYFTNDLELLKQFTDPAAIQVVSKQDVNSVVVQTEVNKRYYWAVDTYIGSPEDPVIGSIFSFFVGNLAPKVDAGKDVVTWLQDGLRTGNLDATVTDDGFVSPYTVQWTVVSEPNDPNSPDAVIADPTAEDTSITLAAPGKYVLQLEAFDGEYAVTDTVTINVYAEIKDWFSLY